MNTRWWCPAHQREANCVWEETPACIRIRFDCGTTLLIGGGMVYQSPGEGQPWREMSTAVSAAYRDWKRVQEAGE